MSILLACGTISLVAGPDAEDPQFAERPPEIREMVDEDEDFAPPAQEYVFNPVQAQSELKIGNFYWKKGSHRAAERRYLEATRWDTGLAEAYRRLGMAREKLSEPAAAATAYTRFLEIEPTGKTARKVRARLATLAKSRTGESSADPKRTGGTRR